MYRKEELEKILDQYGYLPPKGAKVVRNPTMAEYQFALLIKISQGIDKLIGGSDVDLTDDVKDTSDG